ncbi:MAG: HIT domain-containing protein [Saprospiraceae bacterium]|nr:HIT domain-containing protein [Saprospiraceae bacterium]
MRRPGCIFCQIVEGQSPCWKVMETEGALAFLDIHPVARYHTLVVPKIHSDNIFDIAAKDLQDTIALVREVSLLYQAKLGISDIQVVSSNGRQAQQDVFHSHWHVVPRRSNDGQHIRWHTHSEWRSDFDRMLQALVE